jgi:tetratricopeptide (TPR) repeat protein
MDDIMDCFAVLKIQPTNHAHLIKAAYYKALQNSLADTESNNFITLRRCYIKALRNARHIFEESPISRQTPSTDAYLHPISKQNDNQAPLEKLTITRLRHALCLQPDNPLLLTEIAQHYIEINKYRLAIDILKSIRILSPLHTEARHLLLKTEDAWCLRLTKRFHNLSSEDVEYLVRHMIRKHQYRKALSFLEKTLSSRLKGLHAPTLFRLCAECMTVLRVDTAQNYFEKSLEHTHELNENPKTALLAYIEYLFTFQQFETLLLLIDDLIALDPNQHRCHFLKGESLRQTKHYKQSITSLRYAIGLSPYKTDYYDLIAKAYKETGHLEKANSYAEAADKIKTETFNK